MAGFGEAIVLVTAISQCASQIRELGNNYYKATVEWNHFAQQVQQFEERLKFWETECRNRGASSDTKIIKFLKDAKSLLEEEQTKLKKRANSCGSGCWSRSLNAVFPARLGQSIQGATDAINNILGMLTLHGEAKCAIDKLVQAKSFCEHIPHDTRYVPLKVSEAKICEALENLDGPHVVLLHGGAGKGKSTLARYTAVQYIHKKKLAQPPFDHVFFLSCGPNAKVEETLFELIQRLGSDPVASPEDSFETPSICIRKQIRGLLEVQKVLIILDDVSNGEFLLEIVRLCGNHVKCLVTSQLATLCEDTLRHGEFLNIQIQNVGLEDARKILASHVGVANQQIPENVQEVADNMISETESNPLALASLANAIDPNRYADLKEWDDVSTNFFHTLHEKVKVALFDSKYQRSFWSTTKMSIDSLRPNSQNLLFLIHACQGPSIPEEVAQLLYEGLILRLQTSKVRTNFSIVRRELESKELIKITAREAFGNVSSNNNVNKQQRLWSIHSLHKCYIQEEMIEERDSIFTSLAKRENETTNPEHTLNMKSDLEEVERKVVIALCALYLEGALGTMAAMKMGISSNMFSTIRRQAIEPIILLLAHPLSHGHWTKVEEVSTREVFLQYICNDALDDSNISHLLTIKTGAFAMCRALRDIAFLNRSRSLDSTIEGVMRVLINWLKEDVVTSKQEAAMAVLHEFSSNRVSRMFIASFPGVLETIDLLIPETPSNLEANKSLQVSCVGTIGNLACGPDDIKVKIVDHPGALLKLVNSLSIETNTTLQAEAARALANLACGVDDMTVKIVDHPGALGKLVNSLSIETNSKLQAQAARVLSNLASGPNNIRMKIANHQGALLTLVESLSNEANADLQGNCAWALASLAYGPEDIKVKIVDHPGALLKLVNSLSIETNTTLQAEAARALANLACGVDDMMVKIADHPGALGKLVNSLSIETNSKLQAEAARVLSNLASGPHNIRTKIANHQGALLTLLESLSNEANADLQGSCAWALASLANGPDDIKVKIVDHPGALLKLVNSLSIETNTTLQAEAARALANLACGVDDNKVKIANHPGALGKLVNSLSIETNTKLQAQAARVLSNLASGPNNIQTKIANHQGALLTLVESLSNEANANLQGSCAWALASLANGPDDIKVKIVDHPGALLKLVNSLSIETNTTLQVAAARALANLAYGVDDMRVKIADHPGALGKLVNSLSIETNTKLQAEAARVLSNLASGPNNIRTKIANHEGALLTLVESLSSEANANLQGSCAWALASLANGPDDIKVKIVDHPGALLKLVNSLSIETNTTLQAAAARALANLAYGVDDMRVKIADHPWALMKLMNLLFSGGNAKLQEEAARAITFLDPTWGYVDREHLCSGRAYVGRASANFTLGLLKEALIDLAQAHELEPQDSSIFRCMCFVRAKMGDHEGALVDADNLVNSGDDQTQSFYLQERGVLKRMMGDLDGALTDLTEGLALETDNYERLKHRGYVKFLMGDKEGAQVDAEWALRIKPSRIDNHGYGIETIPYACLGVSSVEYLGYKLK